MLQNSVLRKLAMFRDRLQRSLCVRRAKMACGTRLRYLLSTSRERARCRSTANAYPSLPIQASKADEWTGGALGESQVTPDTQTPSCQAARPVGTTGRFKSVRFKLSSNDGYDAKCAVKGAQVRSQRKTRPLKTSSTSRMGSNKK